MTKQPIKRTMTVTAVERPVRKLFLIRSIEAADYFCAEMGCDWVEHFGAISERFDAPALLTLPENMIKPGTGNTAAGIEVPMDYNKPIPTGCDMIVLQPCTMLYFQGTSFQEESDFDEAINILLEEMAAYNPAQHGWQYALELAPYFNFGASAVQGAKMARPVRKVGLCG